MTRKDYVVMAEVLNKSVERIYDINTGVRRSTPAYEHNQLGGFRLAIDTLICVFKQENERFDGQRFIDAVFKTDSEE